MWWSGKRCESALAMPDHIHSPVILTRIISGSFNKGWNLMNVQSFIRVASAAVVVAAGAVLPSHSQQFDMAAMQKWATAEVIHYEVVGVLSDKHVQIPNADADQYGDVLEQVTLSFDWNRSKAVFVGKPVIKNTPSVVTNLTGMGDKCPAGEMKGPYEHFDVTEIKANGQGAAELIGIRKHPDTMVAESCGAGLKLYKAGDEAVSTWIGPPDPSMLALGAMMPAESGLKISADGKSLIMSAQNNNWVWTFTPSVK
jgi:hypothetical protein